MPDKTAEVITTWRLLRSPKKPGEVRATMPRGTVRITQPHIDAAVRSGSMAVIALVPVPRAVAADADAADSEPGMQRWEIVRIGNYHWSSREFGEDYQT